MHSGKPVLSVILPVFNCEEYVGEAIESILQQSLSDLEVIVADDGSSDSSRHIIDGYARIDKRIRVAHNLKNQGKVATSNRLLKLCRGAFVTVHDADDRSLADRFNRQVTLLKENPELIMCGTGFNMVNADLSVFREVVMSENFDDIVRNIQHASQFHGPTMVIRRSALDDCLYRPFFQEYNEDCDLALRLIEKGPCTNLPAILYIYRILPGALSKKNLTARKKSLYKMAWQFHEQRMRTGTDDLMAGLEKKAEDLLEICMKPYHEDLSLVHRENAAFLMYYQLNRSAIMNAWRACCTTPLDFSNWRTLQYCIRKTLLGI